MPKVAPKISDWLASFGAYLSFRAGPATGTAAIYTDPQRAILGVADRSGALLGFDSTAHEWPEPPPRPEAPESGGDRGIFCSRLKKAFPALGARPAVRLLVDAPGGGGIVMRFYSAGERVTIRSGALLRDTLEHNASEIFAGLTGTWRWAVLDPALGPATDGESAHFLVVGLSESYAASAEAWTRSQGLILDELVPAPLALLCWLAERLPNAAAVGVLRSLKFRVVLVGGVLHYFELLKNPYEGWEEFAHAAWHAAEAGGVDPQTLPFVHWGDGEPLMPSVTPLRGEDLARIGGGSLPGIGGAARLQNPPAEMYLLAWAASAPSLLPAGPQP